MALEQYVVYLKEHENMSEEEITNFLNDLNKKIYNVQYSIMLSLRYFFEFKNIKYNVVYENDNKNKALSTLHVNFSKENKKDLTISIGDGTNKNHFSIFDFMIDYTYNIQKIVQMVSTWGDIEV